MSSRDINLDSSSKATRKVTEKKEHESQRYKFLSTVVKLGKTQKSLNKKIRVKIRKCSVGAYGNTLSTLVF